MRKIGRIEIAEITPNIDISDLLKLRKNFPDLNISFGVELYGSPENGNPGIDDKPRIALLKELNLRKPKGPGRYDTAAHLNHGYCAVFRDDFDYNKCGIWTTIGDNTDKVIYNINTLSDLQKQNWSADKFIDMANTRANPSGPRHTNSDYYIVLHATLTAGFINQKIFAPEHNSKYKGYVKALVFDNAFDNWIVGPEEGRPQDMNRIAAAIFPEAWCGGIAPHNIGFALTRLAGKLGGQIEKIDICSRGGAMTGGESDPGKIEHLLFNADKWQKEFNERQR
ncbi:MAG: hypothetical protein LBH81_03185 [Rickettsiales bacterium]|jgi:hypothetical protein|nr:hypothetical protein [Rickettsiales bacterium]